MSSTESAATAAPATTPAAPASGGGAAATGGNGSGGPPGGDGSGGAARKRARPARRRLVAHPRHGEPGSVRSFGLVVLVGFGLIGAFLLWRGFTHAPYVLWALGAATCGLSLVAPGPARLVQRAWMAVAMVLGRINTTVLLSLVHFTCFGGLRLIFALMGRDGLKLRIDRGAPTYWEKKAYRTDAKSYFSQF